MYRRRIRHQRDHSGPTSLNLLVIAGSGERKDTCDDLFMGKVRGYQDEQSKDLAPEVERYQAK